MRTRPWSFTQCGDFVNYSKLFYLQVSARLSLSAPFRITSILLKYLLTRKPSLYRTPVRIWILLRQISGIIIDKNAEGVLF